MWGRIVTPFVRGNKSLCRRLNQRWPRFALYQKGASHAEVMRELVGRLISERSNARVLEVGGVDRPLLSKGENLRYDGLDITFTDACADLYDRFHLQSIEEPVNDSYDLIISHAVLEHVRSTAAAFRNIYDSLTPGGVAVHYLPSRFHPYSLALRAVGPKRQGRLISLLRPWAKETTGYPTYFDKCSPGEIRRLLAGIGFRRLELITFHRGSDYFCFFFPLFVLVTLWDNLCRRLNWKEMCSGFIVVARK